MGYPGLRLWIDIAGRRKRNGCIWWKAGNKYSTEARSGILQDSSECLKEPLGTVVGNWSFALYPKIVLALFFH
jgi:hypothetical protein